MATDTVSQFAAVGAELLAEDTEAAYRGIEGVVLDPIALRQPGFCGSDYRGLVVIGLNPGRGTGDAEARLCRWNEAYKKWRDSGWSGYQEALGYWMRDAQQWRVWNQWVAPVLQSAGFSASEIAYLNLVKVPTVANRKPSARLLDVDWRWTKRQIELLAPRIIMAGGVVIEAELRKRWPSIPFEMVTQNRARSQNTRTRDEQARRIGDAVRAALGPS